MFQGTVKTGQNDKVNILKQTKVRANPGLESQDTGQDKVMLM